MKKNGVFRPLPFFYLSITKGSLVDKSLSEAKRHDLTHRPWLRQWKKGGYAASPLDQYGVMYYSEIQRRFIMVASRMVQARVPGDIQDIANQVIQASGLTVSDVVRVLMTRIAQDKSIPLGLFQPNAETLAAFAEIERGETETVTLDDLRAVINADD